MIKNILNITLYILAIVGWFFFISITFIAVRWNDFVNRNPNAQDIINRIIIEVIFKT
jgi:threonine/homoserine/homoserine lactone efflux protein